MQTHALPPCPRRARQQPAAGTWSARTLVPVHTAKTEPLTPRPALATRLTPARAGPDFRGHERLRAAGPSPQRLRRLRSAGPDARQRAGGLLPAVPTAGSSPPALQLHAENNFQRKKSQQICYLRSHPSSRGKIIIPKLPPHLHLISFSLCLRLNCGPALGLSPCSERPFPSTRVLRNSPRSRKLN